MFLGLGPKLLMDFGIIVPKLLIDFGIGPKSLIDFGIIVPKLLFDFGRPKKHIGFWAIFIPKITNRFWDVLTEGAAGEDRRSSHFLTSGAVIF